MITDRRALAPVAAEWDRLALLDARDGFFRSASWCLPWFDLVRPGAVPHVLVWRGERGGVLGVAPLCRAPFPDLGFTQEALGWAGREVVSGDFLGVACAPEHRRELTAALLAYLEKADWRLLMLGELEEGSAAETQVLEMARRRRLPYRVQEPRMCPGIALPATFDDYLGGLGSSTRYHIRRRLRDAAKAGAAVSVFEGVEAAARLPELKRLHECRWRRDGQPGTLGRPGFLRFLEAVCTAPPQGTSARLYFLGTEDAPAAALLLFRTANAALYYQAGWDPDSPLAAQSPAVVLMAESIRDSIGAGLQHYEFLRGDEGYKAKWTKTWRNTSTVLVGSGVKAGAYLRAAALKDLVKKNWGGRFGIPAAAASAAAATEPPSAGEPA
ncbi:MAG: GNAT family N-acetyltransferase [Bryobacterales bacterium]|nr:GNAT family N-acetyltransferase [Bryobacterales bacterium]